MKRRILCAFLSVILLISLLSGCAAIIEGEYSSTTPHKVSPSTVPSIISDIPIEVSSYSELSDAVYSFVKAGREYGTVKFSSYSGDIESDVEAVCMETANDTPLGAYAVYYINYSLNQIVSYYQAYITITYKKPIDDMLSVKEMAYLGKLRTALNDMLISHTTKSAFIISDTEITPDLIQQYVDEAYYSDPLNIPYIPVCSVSSYPDGVYPCVMEVSFTYPYSDSIIKSRSNDIKSNLLDIVSGMETILGDEALIDMINTLSDKITYDSRYTSDDYNRWYSSYTLYGAIVLNKASSEGFALSLKALCDKIGIECYVVRGRLNNLSHAWNIVKLESGSFYHVDCSQYDGINMFFTDEEMSESYWWDNLSYPNCDGDSLMIVDELIDPEAGAELTGEALPVNADTETSAEIAPDNLSSEAD